jgi:sugar lactone lactonase YvrE
VTLGAVTVDPNGKFAYTANEGGISVSGYTINPATGALTLIAGSPFGAGGAPDSVTVGPSGKFAYVANFLSDDVDGYTINPATGALFGPPPFAAGAGPISVTVDPRGKFAYVANNGDNNVSGYTINPATAALTPIAGSPFAAGTAPSSVAVDPSGKFAYVANQGDNNVSHIDITRSNEPSSYGNASASPSSNCTSTPSLLARALACPTRFGAISMPVTTAPARAAGMARLPVPHATSSTLVLGRIFRRATNASATASAIFATRPKSPAIQVDLIRVVKSSNSDSSAIVLL